MSRDFHVAYLIMCHKNPNQVNRLISRLQSEQSVCFVHVDSQADFKAEILGGGTDSKPLPRSFRKLLFGTDF